MRRAVLSEDTVEALLMPQKREMFRGERHLGVLFSGKRGLGTVFGQL